MADKNYTIDLSDSVCIIGGGAAGMMAACIAGESGVPVVLFEKNRSERIMESEKAYDNAYLGKKLLITGKGRCNLTNDATREEFMKNVPHGGKFLFASYAAFPPEKVMAFFEERGCPLKAERGNRVFPVSDKALDILKTLKKTLSAAGVRVINRAITEIGYEDEAVTSLADENGTIYRVSQVILCTGGRSYPITGSTGDGYRFAEEAGHTVTPIRPSLVPLVSGETFCRRLQGLSLRNVTLTLEHLPDGKKVYEELGEMLFTHFGVSGPLVLSASAHITEDVKDYQLVIDLKPGLSDAELDARLLSDFSENLNKDYKNILGGLLPAKLVPIFAERSGIPSDQKVHSVTKAQRASIVKLMKRFTVALSDFRPIDEAIITRGGVKTNEINPSTMESKYKKGLHIAGELLDADGYTGGFNLQIAFSTACLAARHAVKALTEENELQ